MNAISPLLAEITETDREKFAELFSFRMARDPGLEYRGG